MQLLTQNTIYSPGKTHTHTANTPTVWSEGGGGGITGGSGASGGGVGLLCLKHLVLVHDDSTVLPSGPSVHACEFVFGTSCLRTNTTSNLIVIPTPPRT